MHVGGCISAILKPFFVMQALHQGDSAPGMAAHPVQELCGTFGPREAGGRQSPSRRSLRAAQRQIHRAARRRRRVEGAGRGAPQIGGVYCTQEGLISAIMGTAAAPVYLYVLRRGQVLIGTTT